MDHDYEYYKEKLDEVNAKLTDADRKRLAEVEAKVDEDIKHGGKPDGSDLTSSERLWVQFQVGRGGMAMIPLKYRNYAFTLMWQAEVRRRAIQILVNEHKISEGGIIGQYGGGGLRGRQLEASEEERRRLGVDEAEAKREALIQAKIKELTSSSKGAQAASRVAATADELLQQDLAALNISPAPAPDADPASASRSV